MCAVRRHCVGGVPWAGSGAAKGCLEFGLVPLGVGQERRGWDEAVVFVSPAGACVVGRLSAGVSYLEPAEGLVR